MKQRKLQFQLKMKQKAGAADETGKVYAAFKNDHNDINRTAQ
jgi:hypothetical protein